MDLDMMLFQELAFTLGLSVVIYFILCKFHSNVSLARDNDMGFCCVDASEKAVLCEETQEKLEVKDFVREGRVGCVKVEDFINEEFGMCEQFDADSTVDQREVEDKGVKGSEAAHVDKEDELKKDEGIVGGDGEIVEKVADQREVEDEGVTGNEAAYVDKEDEGIVNGDDEKADKVVDESSMRRKLNEIEVEDPLEDDFREIQIELGEIEGSAKMEGDEGSLEKAKDKMESEILREGSEDNEEGLFDDDWEGIERTELEKVFGYAVVFVDSKGNADQLDNDVKMQLYGLHKVATDGPCCRTQPMALKLSARAKWNAWQRLGDISREEAMEQYIALLSRSITDWKDEQ